MDKKPFAIILIILLLTFLATVVLRYYRAPVERSVSLEMISLSGGGWIGQLDQLPKPVIDLLSPDHFFSASYTDNSGFVVQVFVDYYSPQNTTGAIHSPRNCLPGSGWVIAHSQPRTIAFGNRRISAGRLVLTLGDSRRVMDFWYITRFGETASDYVLKLNTMVSSLMLRPTDKAFVRFVAADSPQSIAAMERFERLFIAEIYSHLPF
jgi:EpsI family protein